MKKILSVAAIFVLPFLFSGCGKKQPTVEKVPEQTAQQETNATISDNQKVAETAEVPLPQGEDIVRLFFNLINEGKIPEAVAMMDELAVPNDSAKQAWGVQFNIFSSIAVKSIEPSNIGDEIEDQKTYKVVLDAKIKPGSEKAVIPNYGWVSGENIRWVSLKKDESGIWKILGIGTGP
jgi:hypothetical protein